MSGLTGKGRRFKFYAPKTDIIFYPGALEVVGYETRKLGKVALLVTGRSSMKKLGFLDKAIESLMKAGVRVIHYGEVEPNPTVDIVNEGAKKAIQNACDVIVGFGGGSSIDTAKAIAVAAGHARGKPISIWDFISPEGANEEITAQTLPLVTIPSTSGTGSHVSQDSVITNSKTKQKQGFGSPFLFPKISIIDIEILSKMSPRLTAIVGFDALTHAIESFFSAHSNPISELYSLEAIRLIFRNLPQAYENGDDQQARKEMALADTYAGWADTTTSDILPHAMAHPVSGHHPRVAHGVSLAALFPAIMRFNLEGADKCTIEKYCKVTRAATGKSIFDNKTGKEEASKSVDLIEKLLKTIKLNVSLKDLDVERTKFKLMAEDAIKTMPEAIQANPRKVSEEDIVALYEQCY